MLTAEQLGWPPCHHNQSIKLIQIDKISIMAHKADNTAITLIQHSCVYCRWSIEIWLVLSFALLFLHPALSEVILSNVQFIPERQMILTQPASPLRLLLLWLYQSTIMICSFNSVDDMIISYHPVYIFDMKEPCQPISTENKAHNVSVSAAC